MSSDAVKELPFGSPVLGEEERLAALEALSSPQLVHGPRAHAFESQFASMLGSAAKATSVSSCTAGLHLIYMHLGIGPGDEVIVPAQTHVATAHAVEVTGARPVFVDSDATGNMDVQLLERYISEHTKAICVVHYPGLPVDVRAVMEIAKRHGIFVVEDCALAIGASLDGIPCGLLGDAASFSFYPAKHMTTAEGGMVVSRHTEVVESIANIKAFGYDRSPQDRQVPGIYNIARLGLNYRMNEVSAAIGIVQLGRLPQFMAARNRNAHLLRSLLDQEPDVTLLPDGDERRQHGNYCVVAVLSRSLESQRDAILVRLRTEGIGLSVHYPVALPMSSYYQDRYGASEGEFPNASRISRASLALPIGPHLDTRDVERIANSLRNAVKDMR